MGQIQNAISGLVSTTIGAQLAGEMKTQREIGQVTKDVENITGQIESFAKHQEEVLNTTYPSMDAFKKADAALQEEYTRVKGWQTRIQDRLNALKKKGATSIDLEIAIKQSNERIAAIESIQGGKK